MGPLANPANHAIVWLQLYFLLFFLKTEVFQNLLFYSKIKVFYLHRIPILKGYVGHMPILTKLEV